MLNVKNLLKSSQEKNTNLEIELEKEKSKSPQLEIREKEVIKTESKCRKCRKEKYDKMLIKLTTVTVGAVAYGIIITMFSIIRNKVLLVDVKQFCSYVGEYCKRLFTIFDGWFYEISSKIENSIVHKVTYGGLWVLSVGIFGFTIYMLIVLMRKKVCNFWNVYAGFVLLVDLAITVFFSDNIKRLFNINLTCFAIIVYCLYFIINVIVKSFRKRD